MRTLILTVGLPRAGKSTWAKTTGHPIVNPDSIRLAMHGEAYIQSAEDFVWATAKCMVKALFLAGHDTVILDATNTTIKRQEEWNSVAEQVEAIVVFKMFATMAFECKERAMADGREDLIPVIDRMAGARQNPPLDQCI